MHSWHWQASVWSWGDLIAGSDLEARLNSVGEDDATITVTESLIFMGNGVSVVNPFEEALHRLSSQDRTVWSKDSLRRLFFSSPSSLLRRRENSKKGWENDRRTMVELFDRHAIQLWWLCDHIVIKRYNASAATEFFFLSPARRHAVLFAVARWLLCARSALGI